MSYQSFEDLIVWQRACKLSVATYQIFMDCQVSSLKYQIEKSALSVPSNIAEGSERNSKPDFRRFLSIALGSNGEFRTHLYIAKKLDLVSLDNFQLLLEESKEISAMLFSLWKSLGDPSESEN